MSTEPPCQPDPALFISYVEDLYRRLLAYALILCGGDQDEAEDLVNEVFLKLWKHFLENPTKILDGDFAYASTALVNIVRDRSRYRERHPHSVLASSHEAEIASRDDTAKTALSGMFHKEVWAAVKQLPERQRELIFLHYFAEYSISAAARTLGLAGTTAARYHTYALRTLKVLLAGHEEEDQVG